MSKLLTPERLEVIKTHNEEKITQHCEIAKAENVPFILPTETVFVHELIVAYEELLQEREEQSQIIDGLSDEAFYVGETMEANDKLLEELEKLKQEHKEVVAGYNLIVAVYNDSLSENLSKLVPLLESK